jgi:serine protease Do
MGAYGLIALGLGVVVSGGVGVMPAPMALHAEPAMQQDNALPKSDLGQPAIGAEKVLNATLMLRSADGRDRFLGSAFVYVDSHQAVTNDHVVEGEEHVIAVTQTGERIRARVKRRDGLRDLALLELERAGPSPLYPGQALRPGAAVLASGAPLEAGFSLTTGVVSALGRQVDPKQPIRYVQHSAAVNPGSSGGPLVDQGGRVIGVNSRISDGSRFFVGIAYAIPVSEVQSFVAGRGAPRLTAPGLRLRPLDPRMRKAFGFRGQGVLVDEVLAASPAEQAGLMAGDILGVFDDLIIAQPGDLAFALATSPVKPALRLWRDGTWSEITMDLSPVAGVISAGLGVIHGDQLQGDQLQVGQLQGGKSPAVKLSYHLFDLGLVAAPDGRLDEVRNQGVGFLAGLSQGDRIIAIDGIKVGEMTGDWPKTYAFDRAIVLRMGLAQGSVRHYVIDPWAKGRGLRPASGANVLDQEVVSFD